MIIPPFYSIYYYNVKQYINLVISNNEYTSISNKLPFTFGINSGKYGYYTTSGTFVNFRSPVGNATSSQVLSGYTFANSTGDSYTGTALATATNATASTILKGYTAYNNNGTIMTGTMNGNATQAQVLSGYTFINNSGRYTGTYTPVTRTGTATSAQVLSGYTFSNSSGSGYTGTYVPAISGFNCVLFLNSANQKYTADASLDVLTMIINTNNFVLNTFNTVLNGINFCFRNIVVTDNVYTCPRFTVKNSYIFGSYTFAPFKIEFGNSISNVTAPFGFAPRVVSGTIINFGSNTSIICNLFSILDATTNFYGTHIYIYSNKITNVVNAFPNRASGSYIHIYNNMANYFMGNSATNSIVGGNNSSCTITNITNGFTLNGQWLWSYTVYTNLKPR